MVFCLAYIAVVVSSRLSGLDPNLEEAALDLGANPVQAMIKVLYARVDARDRVGLPAGLCPQH
jgi:ABC-type spermidine/putrescine transport system permease subunit II